MKPRVTKMDEDERDEEEEEEVSREEDLTDELSSENSDEEGSVVDDDIKGGSSDSVECNVSEERESRGVVKILNDYLESMFCTEEEQDEEIEEELSAMYSLLWRILSATVGVIAIVVIITKYPHYLNTLHENKLWFSNIKEVEREISFRTEQGLYYSYFKQLIQAPTWTEGYHQLLQDNATEHGRTINIVHRFNILPELLLSIIYRCVSRESDGASVFYVWSVFLLHGLYGATLYITAWVLSDSVLAGIIAMALFIIHRVDATRVNYAIPLRESFAVPVLFLQMLFICLYIRSHKWQKVKLAVITLLSVAFLLSWQFAPFVLLCQLSCLMLLSRFLLLPSSKVSVIVVVIGLSLLVNCVVQNKPPLLISSPALSMIIPAFIISVTPSDGSLGAFLRFTIASAEMSLVLLATILISGAIKIFLNIDADSHVYQLLLAKFQMGDPQDFDSQLYMCTEAFDYMDTDTLLRLCDTGLLLMYGIAIIIYFTSTLRLFLNNALEITENSEAEKFFASRKQDFEMPVNSDALLYDEYEEMREGKHSEEYEMFSAQGVKYEDMNDVNITQCNAENSNQCSKDQQIIKGRPDLLFFLGISVLWSVLAALIIRLKVLWLPSVCVVSGVVMTDRHVYAAFTHLPGLRVLRFPQWFTEGLKMLVAFGYIIYLTQKFWVQLSSEIWPEEVYEFWDPDTVELMEWIQSHTPSTAVFAGSMQLLAGVKLCTGRHITNHPHYEDSWLRHRTHQMYKIYGCESPETVYNILKGVGATHIILEDSICLAPPDSKHPLCRLIDIVDLHSGHLHEGEGKNMPRLQVPQHTRFCDAVRRKAKEYNVLFTLVMSNKTFRVYIL